MLLFVLLLLIAQIVHTESIKTTSPVSIILDGFTLKIWNKTRISIVHHLNEICKKDIHCDAEYGIHNIHLLNAIQYGSAAIHLNITADEPILPLTNKTASVSLYNYTALLADALFQTKIDIEQSDDNKLLNRIPYSSTPSRQNSDINRTSRLLSVLLGILLVTIVFALTVFFFQKIRQHRYLKSLKTTRTCQQTNSESLTNPSV